MVQEITSKCKSIMKRQSTLDNQNLVIQDQNQQQHKDLHVKFGEMHVDMILKEEKQQIEVNSQERSKNQVFIKVLKPKLMETLSEAELIKLVLKNPEILKTVKDEE